jgi:hypothetical protein
MAVMIEMVSTQNSFFFLAIHELPGV